MSLFTILIGKFSVFCLVNRVNETLVVELLTHLHFILNHLMIHILVGLEDFQGADTTILLVLCYSYLCSVTFTEFFLKCVIIKH